MANPTRPWFQFDARVWLTDEKVLLMSLECQGAYVRLLCLQWENGSIPREPDDISTMLGFHTKDSRRYFFDRLWPDLKPHFSIHQEHKRRNHRLSRLRDAALGQSAIRRKIGQKGGLQKEFNKRLSKQKLKQSPSDGDGDGDKSKNREEKTLREETPLTPLAGGDKIHAVDPETGSRANGTNPRALAAHEARKARNAEVEHRLKLIRKLEASGEHNGTYAGDRGFRLWNAVTTAELEELTN